MQNTSVCIKYFSVDRCDIAYLRFIIESYDNLAILSTVDSGKGIVSLNIPIDFIEDAQQLVRELSKEISIREINPPEESSDLCDCNCTGERD